MINGWDHHGQAALIWRSHRMLAIFAYQWIEACLFRDGWEALLQAALINPLAEIFTG